METVTMKKAARTGIPQLPLPVQKLENESAASWQRTLRVRWDFRSPWGSRSDISDTMVGPVGPGRAVEGLADGEEIRIEECEDDSNEGSHFLFGEEDVEAGDGDDEHGGQPAR